jgi:predicted RNA methylase
MSATNRGGLSRAFGDFYETKPEAVRPLLDELRLDAAWEGYAVDAGSGTGAIADCIARRCTRADIRGIEASIGLVHVARKVRAPTVVFEHADFLTWKPEGPVDLCIFNPPYGKRITVDGHERTDEKTAEKFVRRALEIVGKRGTVAALLRGSFMVPKVRRELRNLGEPDLLFLEKRPSFVAKGTDATDYAWHVWGPKRGGKWKVLSAPRTT